MHTLLLNHLWDVDASIATTPRPPTSSHRGNLEAFMHANAVPERRSYYTLTPRRTSSSSNALDGGSNAEG